MYPLSRLWRIAAVTMSALVLTSCAAMTVHSYMERGVDFSR